MYSLTNENIIMAAGGPMGSPSETRYIVYFNELQNAKQYAEREHGEQIKWKQTSRGSLTSGDLGDTEYTIERIITED